MGNNCHQSYWNQKKLYGGGSCFSCKDDPLSQGHHKIQKVKKKEQSKEQQLATQQVQNKQAQPTEVKGPTQQSSSQSTQQSTQQTSQKVEQKVEQKVDQKTDLKVGQKVDQKVDQKIVQKDKNSLIERSQIKSKAPSFTADALMPNKRFKKISLSDYLGK